MSILPNLLFLMLMTTAIAFAFINFNKIRRNISLGKAENLAGNRSERFKTMLLVAFGQKKMFDRPVPALLHLFVYTGFLIVNIEMLEIACDGIFGTHRIFLSFLGSFYPFIINVFEFFGLAVIISCAVFLVRRNVLKLKRFQSPEMENFPRRDANTILYIEITLMLAFLCMNAADKGLQLRGAEHYIPTGDFFISGLISPLFNGLNTGTLIFLERAFWWLHITGVFLFLNYLPFSKHLHIILAFPNTYFSNIGPDGKIKNMDDVTREVKSMLNIPLEEGEAAAATTPPGRFGAKDVTDLSWKNLLNAYSCTECGRCTSVCPANLTGKQLSPRKIMMDTRDRLEEVGRGIDKNGSLQDDGKALLGDYISHEELLACTTCNACVDACPVNINPLDIIVELRRYKIMEESAAPASWNSMFANLESSFSPWKFSPSDRFNWSEKME